jgi:hypothetical protein
MATVGKGTPRVKAADAVWKVIDVLGRFLHQQEIGPLTVDEGLDLRY